MPTYEAVVRIELTVEQMAKVNAEGGLTRQLDKAIEHTLFSADVTGLMACDNGRPLTTRELTTRIEVLYDEELVEVMEINPVPNTDNEIDVVIASANFDSALVDGKTIRVYADAIDEPMWRTVN